MELRKFINTTIREFLNEQNSIDTILDKINKSGIDSLTPFEKEVLSKSKFDSSIEDDTIIWLNSNYSNLHTIKEKRKSFDKIKEYVVFLNDDMEMEFEYDVSEKKLYFSYEDIRKNLGKHFNEHNFKNWFKEKYSIDILRIGNYFKNIT